MEKFAGSIQLAIYEVMAPSGRIARRSGFGGLWNSKAQRNERSCGSLGVVEIRARIHEAGRGYRVARYRLVWAYRSCDSKQVSDQSARAKAPISRGPTS